MNTQRTVRTIMLILQSSNVPQIDISVDWRRYYRLITSEKGIKYPRNTVSGKFCSKYTLLHDILVIFFGTYINLNKFFKYQTKLYILCFTSSMMCPKRPTYDELITVQTFMGDF